VSKPVPNDLLMFDEAMPLDDLNSSGGFKSHCVADEKVKVENLFRFRRGRGDLQVSFIAMLVAFFFLFFFFSQTGWDKRTLPDNLGAYIGHQVGLVEVEGRLTRFGRILKQSWVVPLLCLLLLVPTTIVNYRSSLRVHRFRKRFMQPTDASYEFSKYLAALEYVAYFIAYTYFVPILGYLVSTLILGTFFTWRLGYRSPVWLLRGFGLSVVIVIVFRTLLQIKTPVSIWLYDQLPASVRAFMLTYF